MYSERATKFCEISSLLLFYVVPAKSKVKVSQNLVAFSEYMNFNKIYFEHIGIFFTKLNSVTKICPALTDLDGFDTPWGL